METLVTSLRRHRLVGIDTSPFIYHLEGTTRYTALTSAAFAELERGGFSGITSALTLMELSVRPLQLGLADVATAYDMALTSFPNLTVVNIDRSVAAKAAELRAGFRLRPADALQVAACLEHGATAFLTNDAGLRRVSELAVFLLDDFLER